MFWFHNKMYILPVFFSQVLVSTSYDNTIKMYRDDGDDWSCFTTLGE